MGIDWGSLGVNPAYGAAFQAAEDSRGALQKKQLENQYKLGKDQLANAMKIAQIDSKDKRYAIETQREIARESIAQAREEMLRVGIPEMEIKRWVAEKTHELATLELQFKREVWVEETKQWASEFGLSEAAMTGMYNGNPTLAKQELDLKRMETEKRLGLEEGALTGYFGGNPTLEREQFAQDQLEQARRYGLDVAQFGAELSSTPDTYFQARRFQGMDVPRLMGGAGASPTGGPEEYGAPVPGVARMGSYLSGQDPFATPYGGQAPQYSAATPGAAPPAQPAAPGGGPTPVPGADVPGALGLPGTAEDDRARQLAAIAKASPPSPYDGLSETDASTLRLMESIYRKNGRGVAGGELDRLKASGRFGFLASAGRALGYSPEEFTADYEAYKPSQGDARLG